MADTLTVGLQRAVKPAPSMIWSPACRWLCPVWQGSTWAFWTGSMAPSDGWSCRRALSAGHDVFINFLGSLISIWAVMRLINPSWGNALTDVGRADALLHRHAQRHHGRGARSCRRPLGLRNSACFWPRPISSTGSWQAEASGCVHGARSRGCPELWRAGCAGRIAAAGSGRAFALPSRWRRLWSVPVFLLRARWPARAICVFGWPSGSRLKAGSPVTSPTSPPRSISTPTGSMKRSSSSKALLVRLGRLQCPGAADQWHGIRPCRSVQRHQCADRPSGDGKPRLARPSSCMLAVAAACPQVWVAMRFDGTAYPSNPTVDGDPLDAGFKGKVLIADD